MDLAERARSCRDYVDALEEERRKIEVFQRDLPLCLQLVTQAIESYRQQMEAEETTESDGPVLEEFIPLKPSPSSSEEEENFSDVEHLNKQRATAQERPEKNRDWLTSVQLWTQDTDPLQRGDRVYKPVAINGGAFLPFDRDKHAPAPAQQPLAAGSSTAQTTAGGGGDGGSEEKEEGQSQRHRKARRCWSPELHRRFLHALQQLGGPHAATPKQIRELMKVDGLTSDEVKSHLQKYRLHMRRPSPAAVANSNNTPQAPQIMVVGGIWVPPLEFAAAATAQPSAGIDVSGRRIYAPVASLLSEVRFPHQHGQSTPHPEGSPRCPINSEGPGSRDNINLVEEDATKLVSPAASSSSRTTTA